MFALKGSSPSRPVENGFLCTYFLGAVAPSSGQSFGLMFDELDSGIFQLYLNSLAKQLDKNSVYLMILDNASYHKTDELVWPKNIYPHFNPPYHPEFNPQERVWLDMKEKLSGTIYGNKENIYNSVAKQWNSYSKTKLKSLTSRPWMEVAN